MVDARNLFRGKDHFLAIIKVAINKIINDGLGIAGLYETKFVAARTTELIEPSGKAVQNIICLERRSS